MTKPNIEALLTALCEVGRPIMKKNQAKANDCVGATRIAIEVLRQFGYRAIPVPCQAVVGNKRWAELMQEGKPELAKAGHEGAHSVGAGYGYGPGQHRRADSFDGHLVALVEPDGYLLDMSADQFSRPEKGIVVEPLWVLVGMDFRWGKLQSFKNKDGLYLRYESNPNLEDTWKGPDWTIRERYRPVADEIVRAIKEAARHGE